MRERERERKHDTGTAKQIEMEMEMDVVWFAFCLRRYENPRLGNNIKTSK